ncbi:MAG: hypothetical protein H6739_22245 [Alphaproteobacteria bacterium]|nr:hypothetical protein [Alphaproteobacteria bacterium]
MSTESPQVLRPERYASVTWRLDRLVEARPTLADARAAVLRPLEALDELADAAVGALSDEPWEVERFRLLLGAVSEFGLTPDSVSAILPAAPNWAVSYEGGLIDHGGLAILGLAALRVGALVNRTGDFLDILFGLAIAAGPAEAIARMGGHEAETGALALMLRNLGPGLPDLSAMRQTTIQQMLTDPTERVRWSTLIALFGEVSAELVTGSNIGGLPAWMGVDPRFAVRTLSPIDGRPGVRLSLFGQFPREYQTNARLVWAVPEGPATGSASTTWSAAATFDQPTEIPDPDAPVVDAGVDEGEGEGPSDEAEPATITVDRRVYAEIPTNAEPGWVGLHLPNVIAAANVARSSLRDRLQASTLAGLSSADLLDWLPNLDATYSLPPWPVSRRFHGGRPRLDQVHVTLPTRSEDPITVSWTAQGATGVEIEGIEEVGPSGVRRITVPAVEDTWLLRMTPFDDNRWSGHRLEGRAWEQEIPTDFSRSILEVTVQPGTAEDPAVEGEPITLTVRTSVGTEGLLLRAVAGDETLIEISILDAQQPIALEIPGVHVDPDLSIDVVLLQPAPEPSDEDEEPPEEVELDRVTAPQLFFPDRIQPVIVVLRPVVMGVDGSDRPTAVAEVDLPTSTDSPDDQPTNDGPTAPVFSGGGSVLSTTSGGTSSFSSLFSSNIFDRISAMRSASSALTALAGNARLDATMAQGLVDYFGERQNLRPVYVELPWLDDEVAVIERPFEGSDDPSVALYMEALQAQAMRTPGLEHAYWVAVVPGTRPVYAWAPGEAALGVAVVTQDQVETLVGALLEAHRTLHRSSETFRMSLEGTIWRNGHMELSAPRVDRRAAGPGAGVDTGVVAVAVDAMGRELSRRPLTAMRDAFPARFSALLPWTRGVAAVELRQGTVVLRRLMSTADGPSAGQLSAAITGLSWAEGLLTWTLDEAGPAPEQLRVSLRSTATDADGNTRTAWVPLACPPVDTDALTLTPDRLARAEVLRLEAITQWSVGTRELVLTTDNDDPRLVIRRVDEGRWIAVLEGEGVEDPLPQEIHWTWTPYEGEPVESTGPELETPDHQLGFIEASVGEGDEAITATRGSHEHLGCTPQGERLPVVLLTPAALPAEEGDAPAQVGPGEAGFALGMAEAAHGLRLTPAMRLPWCDAALAVMAAAPNNSADPAVDALLEALAVQAARAPGLEDALWLALVPGEDAWWQYAPGPGAHALAVATPAGVPTLIEALIQAESALLRPPATRVVRLIGAIWETGRVRIDELRVEERPPSPLAKHDLGVELVALGADELELTRTALRALGTTQPARFAALIPLPSDTQAIELRRDRDVLRRLDAIAEPPTLTGAALNEGAVTFPTPNNDLHVNVRLEVQRARPPELGSSRPAWVPVACLPTEAEGDEVSAEANLHRLGGFNRLRLVATDGWNTVVQELGFTAGSDDDAFAIRAVDAGRFVATRGVPPEIVGAATWVEGGAGAESGPAATVATPDPSATLLTATLARPAPEDALVDTVAPFAASFCQPLAQAIPLVLLRPVVMDGDTPTQVPEEDIDRLLLSAERQVGLRLSPRITLPWVEDPLAVIPEPLSGRHDTRLPLLLERMAVRALRSAGAEDALWLMVVPHAERWLVRRPAAAATAVAVCSKSAIPDLVAELDAELDGAGSRPIEEDALRLLGRIPLVGLPVLTELRAERRPMPRAEGNLVELTAALLTRDGFLVHTAPVFSTHTHRPLWFTGLLPLSREIGWVEIRYDRQIVARARRVEGSPGFADTPRLRDDGVLVWSVDQTYGNRPQLAVELEQSGVRTPAAQPDRHADRLPLPVERFAPWQRMVLAASDAWDSAISTPVEAPTGRWRRLALREIVPGWYQADGDETLTRTWHLDGRVLRSPLPRGVKRSADGGYVRLPDGVVGRLEVFGHADGEPGAETRDLAGLPADAPIETLADAGWLCALAGAPGGPLLSADVDGVWRWHEPDGATAEIPLGDPEVPAFAARAAAVRADGALGVVGDTAGSVVLLPHGGTPEPLWALHDAPVHHLVFSPDGTQLATGAVDGRSLVISMNTASRIVPALCVLHGVAVTAVAWRGDGAALASGDADGQLRIRDAQGQRVTEPLHAGAVTGIGWLPGLGAWVTVGADGVARLLDADGYPLIERVDRYVWDGGAHDWVLGEGPGARTEAVPFGLELGAAATAMALLGDRVAVGTAAGAVALWTPALADGLAEALDLSQATAHEGAVVSLAVVDDRWLLSAGRDGRVVAWDTSVTPPQPHGLTRRTRPLVSLACYGAGRLAWALAPRTDRRHLLAREPDALD